MCEMTGKWNPFENRADKNASALKTALNTTVGKLCLFSSNRVNPDHCRGSNAAIYGIASHSRIHDKRSFVSNGEKKTLDCAACLLEQQGPSFSILLPEFLVNIADNLILKMLPQSHELSHFSFCHTPSTPSPVFKASLLCIPFSLLIFFLHALLLLYLWPFYSRLFNHTELSAESRQLLKESHKGNFIGHKMTSENRRKSPASLLELLDSQTLSHVCGSDFFFSIR